MRDWVKPIEMVGFGKLEEKGGWWFFKGGSRGQGAGGERLVAGVIYCYLVCCYR